MDIIDTHQGKRKDQLRYSNVVVIVGFILIISSVIILKIQQLLNWFSRADEVDKEAIRCLVNSKSVFDFHQKDLGIGFKSNA